MARELSKMSLEELWELFPIYLTEHRDFWPKWYEEEASILKQILPTELDLQINHIGSTAIHGIQAKPIIDIIIEVPNIAALKIVKEQMVASGYICMSDRGNRLSLNKGYTQKGFAQRVFHIHLRLVNDNDEIYFRDYLNTHPEIAKEYESLKLALWERYAHDRDLYTMEKTEFVAKHTKLAKEFFKKSKKHEFNY